MTLARIGRGIRYLLILSVFQILATVIFYYVISKVLTKPEVGLVATLIFTYTTLIALSSLALPVAGAKYVSEFLGRGEEEKASAVAKSLVRLVLISSSIVTAIFHIALILFMVIGGNFSELIPFSLMGVASFVASLKLTYLGLVQGLQLFDKYSIVNLSTTIASYSVSIFLVLNLGLTGFASGVLTGEMVGLALVFFFYHKQLPKTKLSHNPKALLGFSIPVFAMQVVTILSDWVDRILFLAVSLNLALLGVYDLAIRTVASMLVISNFVEALTLPVFSRAYGHDGEKNVTPLLRRSLRYLSFMYFPTALGLAAVSRTVMVLVYGEAYVEGGLPLAILSISSISMAFSSLLGSALKSIGKTGVFVKISLASILINTVIVVVLTPFLGIIGATLARVFSSLFVFLLIFRELGHWIKIEIDLDGLWKGLLSSVITAVSMLCFDALSHSSTPIDLSLEIGLGVLSYILALILLRALRREDFRVLRQVLPIFNVFIDYFENLFSRFIK